MVEKRAILGIWSLLFLVACGTDEHTPDAKFVDLYADLKLVSLALDHDIERAAEMRRVVLAQHGMTSAEFHEHYMQLAGNPDAWRPFQERVVARIEALQQEKQGEPNGR